MTNEERRNLLRHELFHSSAALKTSPHCVSSIIKVDGTCVNGMVTTQQWSGKPEMRDLIRISAAGLLCRSGLNVDDDLEFLSRFDIKDVADALAWAKAEVEPTITVTAAELDEMLKAIDTDGGIEIFRDAIDAGNSIH